MKKLLLTTIAFLFIMYSNAQSTYKIYAGQGYTSNIYVLDALTLDTLSFIAGAGGYRMAYSSMHNKIYSTGADGNIYIVDVLTDSLISIIDPSDGSNNSNELEPIVLSPDQSKLYVGDESSDALFVLNTANDSIIDAVTLNGADEMENMVISPDGQYLYIADNSDILKVNTATLTIDSTISVNGDSHGIEISEDGQTVYSEGSVGVVVVNTSTFSAVDTISSAGYFLKRRTSGSHLVGVGESNYADVTDLSTGITETVSWSSGSARGIFCHPDNSTYFIASTSGIYKIDAESLTVLDSSQQISFQSIVIISDLSSGISTLSSNTDFVKIYPNPFHSILTFELNLPHSDKVSLSIFDNTGRLVKLIQPQLLSQKDQLITVNLSELSGGIYYCKFEAEGRIQTLKVVKE